MDTSTHRVTECKASQDYRLWLRFDAGLEGSVFLGKLLAVRPVGVGGDVERFCRAAVDPAATTVVWDDEIELDPEILYQDLLSGRLGEGFGSSGLAPVAE